MKWRWCELYGMWKEKKECENCRYDDRTGGCYYAELIVESSHQKFREEFEKVSGVSKEEKAEA